MKHILTGLVLTMLWAPVDRWRYEQRMQQEPPPDAQTVCNHGLCGPDKVVFCWGEACFKFHALPPVLCYTIPPPEPRR